MMTVTIVTAVVRAAHAMMTMMTSAGFGSKRGSKCNTA
jgi:hypothetical protein